MLTAIISFLGPVLTAGKTFFSKNKFGSIASIIAIILFLLLYFTSKTNQNEVAELKIANANLRASSDTLRISIEKNGDLEYNKLAYLAQTNSDLKKSNDSLYNVVKNIKGTVVAVISSGNKIVDSGNLKTVVIHDTTNNIPEIITNVSLDTTYSKGNYHKLQAEVKLTSAGASGFLLKDEIGFTALTGIKKDSKGNYNIFVTPNYPGASITSLDGAYIDKNIFEKPDKARVFTFGLNVGYLLSTYDFGTKAFKLGTTELGIQAGVGINISELFRKK